MAIAPSGDIYITGSYHGTIDYTPPGGAEIAITGLSNAATMEGFVAHLDPKLVPVWFSDFGTPMDYGEGHAIDVGPSRVVVGGVSRRKAMLGPSLACTDRTPSATPTTSVVALDAVLDPTSGAPVSCDTFGTAGADVASVVSTPNGALVAGVYGGGSVPWPLLPAVASTKASFVAELDFTTSSLPLAQPIGGDMLGLQVISGIAYEDGTLYAAGTTSGDAKWTTPSPGACFQGIGNTDGFVAAEPRTLGGLVRRSPRRARRLGKPGDDRRARRHAVRRNGGRGHVFERIRRFPAPESAGEFYVGLVNAARFSSPTCL